MAKHAKESKRFLGLLVTSVAVATSSWIGITAFANTVVVDDAGLNFNSGALAGSAAVTQADADNSNDLGEDLAVGDEFHYYNVFSDGATQVDARITMVSESGIASSSNVDGLLDKLDDASGVSGTNAYLQTELDMNEPTGESFVNLKVEFLTGLTTTAGSGTAVTLSNLKLTIMDIDHYQYAQLSGVQDYTFAQSSILNARVMGSGVTRFVETNGIGTSSGDSDYQKSRVSLSLGNLSQIEIRLGQDVLSGSESNANFDLDFSAGGVWTIPEVRNSAPEYVPAPYSGPSPRLIGSCMPSTGGEVTVTGSHLGSVTSVVVEGKSAKVIEASANELTFEAPALKAGTYDVEYLSPFGNITHLDSLRVCNVEPAAEAQASSSFYVFKRFSSYIGDRGGVVASDKANIQSFLEANPGLERVTCLGSTSGVPAIATDAALAQARATNACSIVEELVPGVTTKTAYVTGRGVGQFHRAVVIYGVGTR